MVKPLIYLNGLYDLQYYNWAVIGVLGFNMFYYILSVKLTKHLIFLQWFMCMCDSVKGFNRVLQANFPCFPGQFSVFQPFQAQNLKSNNNCIKCLWCFKFSCSFSWAFKGLGKWVENCQNCSKFVLFVDINKLVCMN